MIPHPDKDQGEDACFSNQQALVVADGVGGWSEFGVDSGIYSRELVSNTKKKITGKYKDKYISNPKQLLIAAEE